MNNIKSNSLTLIRLWNVQSIIYKSKSNWFFTVARYLFQPEIFRYFQKVVFATVSIMMLMSTKILKCWQLSQLSKNSYHNFKLELNNLKKFNYLWFHKVYKDIKQFQRSKIQLFMKFNFIFKSILIKKQFKNTFHINIKIF